MNQIFLLIGPKGSGKSHISRLLSSEFGIHHFCVEKIWLDLEPNRLSDKEHATTGTEIVLTKLKSLLDKYERVCLESTGARKNFQSYVDRLKELANLTTIKIDAPRDECIRRIHSRDKSTHVHLSDEELLKLDKRSRKLKFKADLEFVNLNMSDKDIVEKLKEIVR